MANNGNSQRWKDENEHKKNILNSGNHKCIQSVHSRNSTVIDTIFPFIPEIMESLAGARANGWRRKKMCKRKKKFFKREIKNHTHPQHGT